MLTTLSGWLKGVLAPVCLLALMSLGFCGPAHAAADGGMWTDVPEAGIARTASARQIVPLAYRSVQLDRNQLSTLLNQLPLESAVPATESDKILSLPLADGRYGSFRVVEAPIMEPALAAQFPEIRTYLGQGIEDRTATLRFDVTPTGFHAQIISWEGSTYIDPYQPGDLDHYIVYRKRDAQEQGERPRCLVSGEELPKDAPNFQKRNQVVNVSSGTSLRTYRVAIAATGEYTAFHGGTVSGGLAAITTTLNRVVGIYERELSVRMTLIANNNLIIYTNAGTDPYTNNDGFAMLSENQTNLNAVIGNANFDIGHVVSTGGGGVAGLGVVCNSSQKGRGVTGSPSPIGDPFDVDYVAHEMGHQFGGNHTFNSSNGSCGGGNRNASTAYEVGSGLTIQAYAGICGADNLQSNSADYFHRASLNEMLAFTTNAGSGASCGTAAATGNTPPTVTTATAFTIPRSTPFTLTASGSDPNGDTLTYLWEEFDLGPTNSPAGTLSDNGGPLFRNFSPVTSPSRTFPRLQYILNNANVPPQTTGGFLTGELLPSTNRTMNFRVTARDNRAGGGGTNEASTAITINAASGPFAVTSPNTAVTLDATQPQTITWNVAGTNAAPVNTATVTISLSLDGGNTFPLTLATGEANDGSATLILAGATPTSQGRIRVAADNNVYFDISDVNFTITGNGGTLPVLSNSGQQLLTGNQLIEPNECNQLSITLSNSGTATATAVSAVLSTSTPNVTISQPNAGFADIPVGQSRTSLTPFEISSGSALVCFTNIDLTLTVTYSGGGSPYVSNFSLPVGQAGSSNYSFASSTGATIPAGGTLVAGTQADDAVVDLAVPAGFNFSVYGTAVSGGSTLRVSTNGNLQIVNSGGSSSYSNGGLPSAGNADAGLGSFPASLPVLMPYWDDLDTRTSSVSGGGIYQQVTGTAPNRKWIIEWRGEPVNQSGTAITVQFAIEFNEASNQFAYLYALTGGSGANGASATIGVQSATTGSTFTQFSFNSASVAPGQRLTATLPAAICSSGSGPCGGGGTPGVTLVESGGNTNVTEGGATDSYTAVLNSLPSGDVTLTMTPDAQVSVNPPTLNFNIGNWNVPQPVTVTAVDDSVVEGNHTGTITHSASGGGYNGVSIANVVANITDNDSATVTTAPLVVAEGDSGTSSQQLTLQLAGQVAGGFTVSYQTRNDTAIAGQDYVAASGTVSFDGSANASRTITLGITGDTVPEADERFFVDLSTTAAPAVQLSPAAVSIDIINDDLFADIAVSHQRNAGPSGPGQAISYSATVLNQSSLINVPNTTFSYTLGAELGNITWTCSASGGATCPASGSGAISHNIVLPAGGSVSYTINAVILAGTAPGTSVQTTATANVIAPYSDPNTANNTVPVQFTVSGDALFANGFE
ncbi:MAG: zinc-dependent metalloprotease family protein [Lysobacterales bacterium]